MARRPTPEPKNDAEYNAQSYALERLDKQQQARKKLKKGARIKPGDGPSTSRRGTRGLRPETVQGREGYRQPYGATQHAGNLHNNPEFTERQRRRHQGV